MELSRRGFLGALLAAAAAPAIVKASSLMPIYVPKIITPAYMTLWGDGVHDDTLAMQALLSGGLVMSAGGMLLGGDASGVRIPSGHFKVTEGLRLKRSNVTLTDSTIQYTQPVDSLMSIDQGMDGCLISGVHFDAPSSNVGLQFLVSNAPKPHGPFRKAAHGTYWGLEA
jgi:hypothetical protein